MCVCVCVESVHGSSAPPVHLSAVSRGSLALFICVSLWIFSGDVCVETHLVPSAAGVFFPTAMFYSHRIPGDQRGQPEIHRQHHHQTGRHGRDPVRRQLSFLS